jgi:hypothetical protein
MEDAYNHASSNGRYYANARQIMYAARPAILSRCAVTELKDVYFTQNLLKDYLTKGRFPENNDVLPKTPVPVISVWFPSKLIEEFGANAREFMEGMANTEIGGFFTIVRDGQQARSANIVKRAPVNRCTRSGVPLRSRHHADVRSSSATPTPRSPVTPRSDVPSASIRRRRSARSRTPSARGIHLRAAR